RERLDGDRRRRGEAAVAGGDGRAAVLAGVDPSQLSAEVGDRQVAGAEIRVVDRARQVDRVPAVEQPPGDLELVRGLAEDRVVDQPERGGSDVDAGQRAAEVEARGI